MKCNACWREIEGRGVATTCGHIFCTDDAAKILNSDSSCPLCEQILSKSLMKAVDLSPSDEWLSMAMAGVPPHLIMKSAFKGISFWIGQKDVEAQLTMKKAMQLRQRFEQMQTKFQEKLEQLHGAYQKAVKRIQASEQEKESLSKDKAELQDKYAEKSRQKRKLEEMYDNLRNELDNLKRARMQAPHHKDPFLVQRAVKDMFSEPSGFEDPNTRPSPVTPGQTDFWPAVRPVRNTSDLQNLFDVSAIQPAQIKPTRGLNPANLLTRGSTSPSGAKLPSTTRLFTPGGNNPSNALRNLLLSPMKRPTSRLRSEFTS
ncbi:hypothetical protein GOP47_0006560 [Adiantum capillus-veneris]|uniref:RING-type domain-containing protein n=1 Tax=Adiantum capillus-veneris TaxID=13818 RepID=A0A9D4V3I1_ADICA|nr:hypothetical protein GOP47_0006560 [Adiantum capillus-veneris]